MKPTDWSGALSEVGNYLVAPLWEWQEQQQEKEEEEGNESVGGTTGRVPSGHGDVFTLYGFAMLVLLTYIYSYM